MTAAYAEDIRIRMHAERAMLMLPLNVVQVARIDGHIDADELATAIERLTTRHALLATRVEFDTDMVGWYRTAGVDAPRVRVVDDSGSDGWIAAVGEELTTPFDIEHGPLARFVLVRDGTKTHLIVTAHHVICDGTSLTYVLRDVLGAIASPDAEIEALPVPPVIDATTVPAPKKTGLIMRWILGLMNRSWAKRGHQFGQKDMEKLHAAFVERMGAPTLVARELPPDLTTRLVERCRQEGVTVNSALWSAFLASQHAVQGDAEAFRRMAGMAVSTRDRLNVPVGETLSFHASSLSLELRHDPRASFWDATRTIHAAIGRAVKRTDLFRMLVADQMHPTLLDSLYFQKYGMISEGLSAKMVKKMAWDRVSYGYSITNVGRVNIPVEFGSRRIEAVYGPIIYSDVNEKVVGVTTVGGVLSLSLSCSDTVVGAGTGTRLMDEALKHIRNAIG